AYPTGKPLVADLTGVTKVYLAVKDLDAAIAQFQRTYGLRAPERRGDAAFGAKLASFAGTPVVLAAPPGAQSWLAKRIEEFGEAPCAFVLGRAKPARQITWLDSAGLGWHLGLE